MVVTTSPRGLENLRKNIRTYSNKGGQARRVIFATTQTVTASKHKNLEIAAADAEFKLEQVYDRWWFADELYKSPEWRKRLLDVAGDLPALSALPPKSRLPQLPLPLIGRDSLIAALAETPRDVVVVGPPGVGKTAIFRLLAREGWGLFDNSTSQGQLADAVRKLKPDRIILDDVHFDPGQIVLLRHLREELDVDFSIVGASGPAEPAAAVLANFDVADTIEVPLLSRRRDSGGH